MRERKREREKTFLVLSICASVTRVYHGILAITKEIEMVVNPCIYIGSFITYMATRGVS